MYNVSNELDLYHNQFGSQLQGKSVMKSVITEIY